MMKTLLCAFSRAISLLLVMFVLCFHEQLYAQVAFPNEISFSFNPNNSDYIGNWTPGNADSKRYYASRVPLAKRFKFAASQANPAIPHERQIGLWTPMSGKARQAGLFELNNPNYWQYLDYYCYWSGGSTRIHIPSASYIDAGHRNGAKVLGGCTFADPTSPTNSLFVEMISKNADGTYKHARKLVELADYYGFEGYAFNIEVTNYPESVAKQTRGFFQEATRIAKEEKGLENFELVYYYVHYNNGGRNFYIRQVDSGNDKWLEENGKTTFSQAFLNYEWNGSSLNNSANYVRNNFPAGKNDPYKRVFAGINTPRVDEKASVHPWKDLLNSPVSISLWALGPRRQGFTSAEVKNHYYQYNYEMWSGPNADPSQPGMPSGGYGKTVKTAGMAAFATAKSAIAEYPLVTNFNEGCGTFFAKKGEKTNIGQWNDLSLQDVVPTWRWWWSEGGQNLKASIDFENAYEGGSSLRLQGNPGSGNNVLRLFKTKLEVSANTKLEIAYQAKEAGASGLEAAVAFENGSGLSSFAYLPLGSAPSKGWITKTLDLSNYSGQTLAVLALNVKSSQPNFDVRIGGISLTNGPADLPKTPVSIKVPQLQATGRYISGEITWELPGNPRHNKDAKVKYFELYQMSADPIDSVYLGRSVSRGFIFNKVTRSAGEGNMHFKIVTVGADHRSQSAASSAPKTFDPSPWAEFDMPTKLNFGEVLTAQCNQVYAQSYQWTFEGGHPASSTAQNPGNVTFATPGHKKITLKVTGANGKTHQIETVVTIAGTDTNLALGQPSHAATDYGAAFPPSNANDGNIQSTMICRVGDDMFWEVDLGYQVSVNLIKAWNRHHCCQERVKDYYVLLSKEPFVSRDLEEVRKQQDIFEIHEPGQMGLPSSYDLSTKKPTGRYLRIQRRPGKTHDMGFDEIMVFGQYVHESSLNLSATLNLNDLALIKGETATLTVKFNRAVTGFGNEDLSVSNGTLSQINGSGTEFQGVFTPSENTEANNNAIVLNLSGVKDADGQAGSGTAASPAFSIDTRPPASTSLSLADSEITLNETAVLTAVFSEAVTGLDISDFMVPNGSLSELSSANGGITFTAVFTPSNGVLDNENVISLNLAKISDLAGNAGQGTASTANFSIDTKNGPVNLALNKPASQSSLCCGGVPERAVDGNTSGVYGHKSVTHTLATSQPYWTVDLGKTAKIDSIRIYNRSDCCAHRLSNFHVLVSEQPFANASLQGSQNQQGVTDFHHPGQGRYPSVIKVYKNARYVRVQLTGSTYALSLAEVEVMGQFLTASSSRAFDSAPVSESDKKGVNGEKAVFPSPADDFLNIVSPKSVKVITVYNSQGIMLENLKPDSRKIVLNTSSYASGWYILKVVTEDGDRKNYKFMKR
ncbi:MAG: Ig-like domain-containing protein [Cytophagales bacterium]|nr:Ig-like domain-containing protein [Cytophagales bacterium]